jgi:hypothetical protein
LIDEKNFDHTAVRRPNGQIGRHSLSRMPPASYQPCSFFAVSAMTRP